MPFHFWAPDTYEGAPTPVAAFLSVASKTAGFVALLELVYVGFLGRHDVWEPLFWILAALTMTVGNLIALRQTNIVRMLAYSSIAQAGYILVPRSRWPATNLTRPSTDALTASVVYLLIYAAMNLGAFAVVIAVARKTHSGEICSYGGLFNYAPGLTVDDDRVHVRPWPASRPLGGWFAKFYVFRSVLGLRAPRAAIVLGVIVAVNSVIALYYYINVVRRMWMNPVPDEDRTPIRVPASLATSIGLCGGRRASPRRLPGDLRPPGRPGPAQRLMPAPSVRSRPYARSDDRLWPSASRAGPGASGRCRGRCSWRPPSTTTPTASTRAGGQAGRRGRLRHQPGDRAPLRRGHWPGPSTGGGTDLGRPDPFLVVEAAAGAGLWPGTSWPPGRPAAPALRYLLVERSSAAARGPASAAWPWSLPPSCSARPPRTAPTPTTTPIHTSRPGSDARLPR